MTVIIESLGVHLPSRVVPTAGVLDACRSPLNFPLERITGIRSRRMAGRTEFSVDLARKAAQECLARSRHGAEEVDLVICCNISRCDGPGFRFTYEPSTSVRLRRDLGLTSARCFDVSNACAGMFTGVLLAQAYLEAGQAATALVVSGEYITHVLETAQREIEGPDDDRLACLTLGDAGAAVLLEKGPQGEAGFGSLSIRTLPEHSELCVAMTTDQPHGGAIMYTDSARIHEVAIQASVAEVVGDLKGRGWPRGPFHFVMHQTARSAIAKTCGLLNEALGRDLFGPENAVVNLVDRANTASTSHFVALWDQIRAGRIQTGDDVVFAVQASGVTVGSATYTLDDLPERLTEASPVPPDSPGSAKGRPASSGLHGRGPSYPGNAPPLEIDSAVALHPRQEAEDGIAHAVRAAGHALDLANLDRDDLDLLIFAGVYRDGFLSEPAVASLVAGALGVGGGTAVCRAPFLAFDVFNGALGTLNACEVASVMLATGPQANALVVTSEVDNNAGVVGVEGLGVAEMASAMVLRSAGPGGTGLGAFDYAFFHEHGDAMESWITQEDGRSWLAFTRDPVFVRRCMEAAALTAADYLERNGVTPDEVTVLVAPSPFPGFAEELAHRVGIRRDAVAAVLPGGDPFTAAVPLGLLRAFEHSDDAPADAPSFHAHGEDPLGLIVSVASGIQVGCALYRPSGSVPRILRF